jgi:hypothetical protein
MKKRVLFLLVFFSYSVNAQMVPSFLGVYDKKNPNGTGTVTFTNCSSAGKDGPSQSDCNTSYSGTTLDGDVTVTSGIQLWTVPANGSYTIEVWGAKGGSPSQECVSLSGTTCRGANGARMKGTFSLNQGETLRIGIGQMGESYLRGGGGGGGTFVAKGSDHSGATALIIAGGGGGGHYFAETVPKQGQTTEQGASNPSTGNGYLSGAGGSWASDGANGTHSSTGGKGWANFLVGGNKTYVSGWSYGDGGFGGGGGGCWPGGNGGGYNGGAQVLSYGNETPGGSGGGSYNAGSNQDNTAGAWDSHGKVIITW